MKTCGRFCFFIFCSLLGFSMTTPCHSQELVITPPNARIPVDGNVSFYVINAYYGVPVTWSSSDNNIATINASGRAKGVGVGTAIINAEQTWVDGTFPYITPHRLSGSTTLIVTESAGLESSDAIGISVN